MRTVMLICGLSLVALAATRSSTLLQPTRTRAFIVYVGTYTGTESKGIYAFRFDSVTGKLESLGLAAETDNPSFLAVSPNHRFLYAVNEVDEVGGKKNNGSVSSFAVDTKTGKLRLLNQQGTRGGGPCHLTVDADGRAVLVANYDGGSIAALPIESDGKLGEAAAFVQHTGSSVDKERQEGPHAHGIYLDSSNRFAAVPDLGLDRVLVYRFDSKRSALSPNDTPFASVKPGGGPRHFAFHPNGHFAYVANELNNTVTAFAWDGEKGTLSELQTVPALPQGFTAANTLAELEVHPTGKFLYVSNRGHDSIAVLAVNARTGELELIEHQSTGGKTPRGFAIDPTGRFLLAANQESNTVVVFDIDRKTGVLRASGTTVQVGKPVCVVFVPVG